MNEILFILVGTSCVAVLSIAIAIALWFLYALIRRIL